MDVEDAFLLDEKLLLQGAFLLVVALDELERYGAVNLEFEKGKKVVLLH